MGQKVEVGGTGYDLKGGKTLIGGTAYAIKKGRTLVGGTGYDIKLESEEIWVVNVRTLPEESVADFNVVVVCNGIEYVRISITSFLGLYRRFELYKSDGSTTLGQGSMTLIFPIQPTGELLTWLETYAEKQ